MFLSLGADYMANFSPWWNFGRSRHLALLTDFRRQDTRATNTLSEPARRLISARVQWMFKIERENLQESVLHAFFVHNLSGAHDQVHISARAEIWMRLHEVLQPAWTGWNFLYAIANAFLKRFVHEAELKSQPYSDRAEMSARAEPLGPVSSRECLDAPAILATFTNLGLGRWLSEANVAMFPYRIIFRGHSLCSENSMNTETEQQW